MTSSGARTGKVMLLMLVGALSRPALGRDRQDEFRTWAATTAAGAHASPAPVVSGKDGWLFFVPELRHLGKESLVHAANASGAIASQDPLTAIVDFKRQLEDAGVELLVVPVPAKAAVYPQYLPAEAPRPRGSERLDRAGQALYLALQDEGVRVLDLAPVFAAAGRKGAPLYCRQDTHWSGQGCIVAAGAIAQEVKRRPWYAGKKRLPLVSEPKTAEIVGDLGRALDRGWAKKEEVPLRAVGTAEGGRVVPLAPDKASPVLLLGDSHNLVFHAGGDMLAVGAGLPDQLAFELGFPVDLLAVRGSGATPARVSLARRVRADGTYLAGKKLVVWCFSVREFTESSGWQKIALRPAGETR